MVPNPVLRQYKLSVQAQYHLQQRPNTDRQLPAEWHFVLTPVPHQYRPSVQAYYCLQFNTSTDFRYRRSTIFSTAPVPTNNSQPSDILDEYQYPAVFHSVLCQNNASTEIRPEILARHQASCKFPPEKDTGKNAGIGMCVASNGAYLEGDKINIDK